MSNKSKYLLDTSILIENISQNSDSVIKRLEKNGIARRYHLNHCLIEFRLGLLSTWIGFYLDILATQDIKAAKRRLAKVINFKPRQGSNYVLLDALLSEIFTVIEVGDVKSFLIQLEECISYTQTSISLLSQKIVGSHSTHHLLTPGFIEPEAYEDFYDRCQKDYVIDLATIFNKRKTKFTELLAYLEGLNLKGEELKRTQKIIALIKQGLTEPSKVNSKSQNRRYGDLMIAMDSPKDYCILSSDSSFGLMAPGLKKDFINYNQLPL